MSGIFDPTPSGTVFTVMIPWAEKWHTEDMIRNTLEALGWGTISDVQIKLREGHGKRTHAKVFVHFSSWSEALGVRTHLENPAGKDGKQPELKVWHNETHYWKVRASKWKFEDRSSKTDESNSSKPRFELC